MSAEETKPILIRYEAVDTLLCNVRQVSEHRPRISELGFEIRATIGSVEPDTGMVSIVMVIAITEPDVTEPVARVVAQHKFHIENIELLEKEGNYLVPQDLITELMANAYSTTRGILLARGAGTIVETLVLPMFDARELVRRFMEIQEGNIVLEPETTSPAATSPDTQLPRTR